MLYCVLSVTLAHHVDQASPELAQIVVPGSSHTEIKPFWYQVVT